MKGNGVFVTNDRLFPQLNGSGRDPARELRLRGMDEIYPLVGDYTSLREIGASSVLFDAVSDQIVKINPHIYPLFDLCDGFHNIESLARFAHASDLPVSDQDLMAFFEQLAEHKLVKLAIRRRVEAARVLLLNPPLPFPRSTYAYQNVYPPLGLLYLAGQLLPAGYEVEILDMSLDDMLPAEIGPWLRNSKGPWDLIGISLNMTCSFEHTVRIAANIRDILPDIPIVMGGNHATMTYEEVLTDRHCDLVCLGPGDHLIVDLCDSLFRKNGPIEQIPGLAYWSRGKVKRTCPTQLTKVIKEIHFPAYHLVELERYDIGNRIPVITSTGCPYDCKYCSTVKFNGRRVSYFPVERVVADIKRLREVYGTNGFNFLDDSFTFNRKRMIEICDRVMQEDLRIHWTCNTRVDMVDQDMLHYMRKAGCVGIFYGIESMDQEVLDRMHKSVRTEQIRNAVQWARNAGIQIRQSFIVGLPGETAETLDATLQFIQETRPEEVQLSMLTIYPGTELAATPEKFGLKIHPLRWEEHNINVPHASTDTMDAEAIFDQYLRMRLSLVESTE